MANEEPKAMTRVSIRTTHAAFLDAAAQALGLTNIEWMLLLNTYFLVMAKRLGLTTDELMSLHQSAESGADALMKTLATARCSHSITPTPKTDGDKVH